MYTLFMIIDPKLRYLCIVESPNKISTLRGIFKSLGYNNIILQASVGHISHIADSGDYNIGVNLETFESDYEISKDKKDVVAKLKEQYRLCDKVIIASDGDREGEAIAWSLKHFLNIPDSKYERITYHEITERAVKEAIENSRKIDDALVEAAHARSALDKIVGYRLSPIARTQTSARSVGRCQSAGLKIVVDREREIINFKEEKYYELYLNFEKNKNIFKAKYVGDDKKDISKFTDRDDCEKIGADCYKKPYIISDIETKELTQNAPLPFTTSTFQQEVSSKLGIGVKDAMNYAQKLFEGIEINGKHVALITYHRSDDTAISPDFLPLIHTYIENAYGKKYVNKTVKKTKKAENVQAGHEAIRVIDLNMDPPTLSKYISDNRMLKVYELIFKRTIASQMSARKISDTQYTINNGKHRFAMSSKEELFDGWKKIYSYDKEREEIIKETFAKGEELQNTSLQSIEKATTPPSRYTEASLIKTLDKLGIGRPSTYATIVGILLDDKRGYCKVDNKKLVPTNLAMNLVGFLDKNFPDIVDSSYTANLERSLDEIAEDKMTKKKFLTEFYSDLKNEISKVQPDEDKICPECGHKLVLRKGRYGLFYGCSNYPSCKHIENIKKK